MKWTRYPDHVLPAWVAESDFATCPAVYDAITHAVKQEYFGYRGEGNLVEQALAGFTERRYGWRIDPSWVRVVPDVVKGVAVAVNELTPPGSSVVIPVASYYPFFEVPPATHRPTVLVEMLKKPHPHQPGSTEWGFDLEALEAAFADTTAPQPVGSLILCNPYNPLGRAFRPEELHQIVELADRYNVRIISDEIHGPITLDGHRHTPTASISPRAAELTITVTATSKGWNTAGLHCAQMIITNPADRGIMSRVHNLSTGEASTLGMCASIAAYNHGEAWLDNELAYLSRNLDILEQRLPQALPGASFTRPEATYLVWIDVSQVPGLGANPAATLLKHTHVALSEGRTFGAPGKGHIRMNIATSPSILNEILDRLSTYTALS